MTIAPLEAPPVAADATSAPPGFDPGSSAFLTISMAFVGACLVQVASLLPLMFANRPDIPPNFTGILLGWFAYSGAAAFFGLLGGYHALRRGSARTLSLLVFLLFYSFTARVGNVSFGWPFQLHFGMAFGNFGLGLNAIGLAMALWWAFLPRRAPIADGKLD